MSDTFILLYRAFGSQIPLASPDLKFHRGISYFAHFHNFGWLLRPLRLIWRPPNLAIDFQNSTISLFRPTDRVNNLNQKYYRFNQNKPSGTQHTYVLNEFSTVDCSCTTIYFWKNFYRSLQSTSSRFFWHLLRPNWSFTCATAQ